MRNEKQFLVKEISEKIGSSDYVYFVSFSGASSWRLPMLPATC